MDNFQLFLLPQLFYINFYRVLHRVLKGNRNFQQTIFILYHSLSIVVFSSVVTLILFASVSLLLIFLIE
jgi:hypothetical protein